MANDNVKNVESRAQSNKRNMEAAIALYNLLVEEQLAGHIVLIHDPKKDQYWKITVPFTI